MREKTEDTILIPNLADYVYCDTIAGLVDFSTYILDQNGGLW